MPTTPAARRSLARTLGLNRPFTALTLTALAVLVIATAAEADALYGVACVLALLAGTVWSREPYCNACGEGLHDHPDQTDSAGDSRAAAAAARR
ncbi:hypothetical protein BJ982_007795 [Sphaerisporangium siamense]|uniref:Uncharacterized protein n=1 Tax=Sphaerisporangium siamense TaxID=795645 RepID=A0A7W7GEJ4_9ACTN|nr:hypothetical protein [Sphaerisporangium siamense]MBB4706165.1 hypothetical protein [Sphaerisporangium siamense]